MSVNLQDIFTKATYGINVGRRPEVQLGIRPVPFAEIYSNDFDYLNGVHMELLKLSVSSVVRPTFLRVQGIQNCLIVARYCKEIWWLKCMEMFSKGEHLNKEGLFKLMFIREHRENARASKSRVTYAEAVKIVMEA